jgi:hypothetical protein
MPANSLAIQSVRDLPDGGKQWLETVLGQHLTEDQQIFVMAFKPSAEPNEAIRRQAHAAIERTMAEVGNNLEEKGVTDAGFDAAADDATVWSTEFDELLDEFSAGLSLRPLPSDFSREDVYAGHN